MEQYSHRAIALVAPHGVHQGLAEVVVHSYTTARQPLSIVCFTSIAVNTDSARDIATSVVVDADFAVSHGVAGSIGAIIRLKTRLSLSGVLGRYPGGTHFRHGDSATSRQVVEVAARQHHFGGKALLAARDHLEMAGAEIHTNLSASGGVSSCSDEKEQTKKTENLVHFFLLLHFDWTTNKLTLKHSCLYSKHKNN